MTGKTILACIDQIASTSSTKGKISLLSEYMATVPFLEAVLVATYDPMVTYGITVPQDMVGTGNEDFSELTKPIFNLLKSFGSRDISGNSAKDSLQQSSELLNEESFEILRRIIMKDMRAGFTANSINKAKPKTIDLFKCMLAAPYKETKVKYPVDSERKLDGIRCCIIFDGNTAKSVSREGHHLPAVQHVADKVAMSLSGVTIPLLFDGEIKSGSFKNTVSKAKRQSVVFEDAVFHVFDMISLHEFKGGKSFFHYRERREELLNTYDLHFSDLHCVEVTTCKVLSSQEEVEAEFKQALDDGDEGLILKDPDGLYLNKRNTAWMKIKACETIDLLAIGTYEGEGKYAGQLGGIVVDFNGVSVNVGSGFSDGERKHFWGNQDQVVGRIIEVQYHEVTPDLSLRHPVFKGVRFDKTSPDGDPK